MQTKQAPSPNLTEDEFAGMDLHAWEKYEPREVVDKVHERLAQQLFDQAWVHNLGSMAVGVCATVAVWKAVDHVRLLTWLALFILIYVIRWILALQFADAAPKGAAVHTWVRLQFGAIIASSLAYGAPAVFLWPEGYPLQQMGWVITITAITAAGVARYCVWKFADLPFIFLALFPITFRLIIHGGLSYIILGILGILYSLVLFQIGRVMHKANLENLLTGVKNKELSSSLAQEIDKVTRLNNQLVHEMGERERAFAMVRKKEKELEQARRMESIGILSAGVAHELNTPLQFISDNLQFIAEGLRTIQDYSDEISTLVADTNNKDGAAELALRIRTVKEQRDIDYYLEEMVQAESEMDEGIGRVSTIVQALKLHAGSDTSGISTIDINQAIDGAVLLTHNLWKDVCTVTKNYQENIPVIGCRGKEINQILMNILMNAIQAIEDKKAGFSFKGEIVLSTAYTDNRLHVSIQDNGIGIPREIGERIFEDFYTTRQVDKGMGQGLTFAYRILKQHGGTIRFESKENEGSTFVIELPNGNVPPADTPESLH